MNSFVYYAGAFLGAYVVIITQALGGIIEWWTPLVWALIWAGIEAGVFFVRRTIRAYKRERARVR